MTRPQRLLAAALVVQVALAVATWRGTGRGTGTEAGKLLVEFDPAGVSTLRIQGEAPSVGQERRSVELARQGEQWVVASAADYPAKTEKVDEVLRSLATLRAGPPIAVTSANHQALHVGDRDFARKITVGTSAGPVELVLGTGPRSTVHVRRANGPEVYAVRGISVWNVPDEPRGYIDTGFVEVAEDDLERVTVRNRYGELNLAKTAEGWELAELPPRTEMEDAVARSFLTALGRLTMQRPVGTEPKPEYGLDSGARVTLVKTGKDGAQAETIEYVIGDHADDRSYYAKAADREWVVTVPKWNAEQARDKKPEDFVRKDKGGHGGAG